MRYDVSWFIEAIIENRDRTFYDNLTRLYVDIHEEAFELFKNSKMIKDLYGE